MRFNSFVYLILLGVVVGGLWSLPTRFRRYWLLAASYFFYASWHAPYLLLLIAVTALTHWGARWIVAKNRARYTTTTLVVMLAGLLAVYKYSQFMAVTLNAVCAGLGSSFALSLPKWALPLGISFYTFECISYVVDLARKREKLHSFWDFQLYVAFFPHLIAGPILRAKEFLPQLSSWRADPRKIHDGLMQVVSGLAMKVLLADGIGGDIDAAFARSPGGLGSMDVWLMAFGFGLQVYFDFSAYSRIAIGSARMCGLELVPNFNFPYLADSPPNFWARWHMSLSRWIRDYAFLPLSGNRPGLGRMALAVVASMALCGLWHGAGWNFVLWGIYHGVLVAAYQVATHRKGAAEPKARSMLTNGVAIAGTYVLMNFGWLLFRAQSLGQASRLVSIALSPFHHTARALSGLLYVQIALLVLGVFAAPRLMAWAAKLDARSGEFSSRWLVQRGLALGLMLVACLLYLKGRKEFVYFQF